MRSVSKRSSPATISGWSIIARETLAAAAGKLHALSPLATLERGYAVALGEGAHVLRRAADFRPGMRFDLRVVDGTVGCEATDMKESG